MAEIEADQLHALVDMGSNGIRFSITSLAAPTTRCLPTLYQSRLGISLYDAQYAGQERVPIPQHVIDTIIAELCRFRRTALDFGVPMREGNVRILATEATRTAVNGREFVRAVEEGVGEPWRVEILRKEDEGRVGALGVVSSIGGREGVLGLMMDLGGGSTQITYLIARPGEALQTSSQGSISFPYGAAAMTRLLSEIDTQSKNPEADRQALRDKIIAQFQSAYHDLDLPSTLRQKAKSHGLTLYLSGGGFRGWGYLLMSNHRIKPYPIPIINGFCVPVKDFRDTLQVSELALQSLSDKQNAGVGVFRVSKRRAAQVPAVAFLVDAVMTAIPVVSEVRFCQGGVREGWLFDSLPAEIRAEDPLVAASGRFAADLASAEHFAELLTQSLPSNGEELDRSVPASLEDPCLLRSFANLLFFQQGHPKETAALNALNVPITGALASAHGVGHTERALLALMLCQRWGEADALPPPYGELLGRLEILLTNQEVWWARYLGVVGSAVGEIYPAGRVRKEAERRVSFSAKWAEGLGKKGNMQGVVVKLAVSEEEMGRDVVSGIVESIEEMGKKKNRVGGREYGFGVPLRVDVEKVNK